MEKDYNYLFKVLFVGDVAVGKTQIINNILGNKFSDVYEPTAGMNFLIKEVEFKNKKIKLQLCDSSGHERFRSITQAYYKSTHLIAFVYAINDKKSFNNIQNLVNEVKTQNKDVKFLLIGNKCDLKNDESVPTEEAQDYAKANDLEFFEVSVKAGEGISDDMFISIIKELLDDMEKEENKFIEEIREIDNHGTNTEKVFNSSLSKLLGDEKKEENNNHTYNNTYNFEQKNLLLGDQNKDGIKNKKNFCWSKYCSCCPCLKKSEEYVKNIEQVIF